MDDAHDGSYAREPQLDDLVRLARALNAHHVRDVLVQVLEPMYMIGVY